MAKLDREASGTQHVRWVQAILDTLEAHLAVAAEGGIHRLTPEQVAALNAEKSVIERDFNALVAVVKPYRDFLDRGFGKVRARQRVADYLCDVAQTEAEGQLGKHPDLGRFVTGGLKALREGLVLSEVVRAGRVLTYKLATGAASLLRALPGDLFPMVGAIADKLDGAGKLLERYVDEEVKALEPQRKPLRMAVRVAVSQVRETLDQADGRLRTHFSDAFIASLYPKLKDKGRAVADAGPEEDDVETDSGTPEDVVGAGGNPT